MGNFKIAVYTIALNEERFVQRWFESAQAADLLVIADTGSTDATVEKAKKLGIKVESIVVDPWRFDTARNLNLAMIPDDFDICIQLDMDEVLSDNWREIVEASFAEGNNWPTYKHVTRRNLDGEATEYQMYFKIHPRQGFKWHYPIHEILIPEFGTTVSRNPIDVEVDHLQDPLKDRSSYLDLLEFAVKETPNDWRMNHYLAREYWYLKDWNKVINQAMEVEQLPGGWDIERSSTYIWAGEAAYNLGFTRWANQWADKAINAAPLFFEAKFFRAQLAHFQKDWLTCYNYASQIQTHQRQHHHLVLPHIWQWMTYDLIALSAHHLGKQAEAIEFGKKAIAGNPSDERLQNNLNFYEAG